jgi:hypothetical protein
LGSLVGWERKVEYVALCYSQTEIIARDVVLVGRAGMLPNVSFHFEHQLTNDDTDDEIDSLNETDDRKQAMHHLKAVVFVRPTPNNIDRIKAILQKPKYKEYHICMLLSY